MRLLRRVIDRVGCFVGSLPKRPLNLTGLVQRSLHPIDDGLPRGFRRRCAWGRGRAWRARLRRLLPTPDNTGHHHPNHHRKPASPPLHRNLLLEKVACPLFSTTHFIVSTTRNRALPLTMRS